MVTPSAPEFYEQLVALRAERATARLEGLDRLQQYMEDLRREIEATRSALLGAAVTEIASFRAQLAGPQLR